MKEEEDLCTKCGAPITSLLFCKQCGEKAAIKHPVQNILTFEQYREITAKKRVSKNPGTGFPKRKKAGDKRFSENVFIRIKEMLVKKDGTLNHRSGFSIPLECNVSDDAFQVKRKAHDKLSRYCNEFQCNFFDCKLVYKSGMTVKT